MAEASILTNKVNHLIDPVLHIWGVEVAVYLFLGGLTAGALIVGALVTLTGRQKTHAWAAGPLLAAAPVLISLGMGALFLDLENKFNVWRFYTAFQPTSPMSWGAWVLLLVYPLNVLLVLATWRETLPWLYGHAERRLPGLVRAATAFAEPKKTALAGGTLAIGIVLGFYTGILLAAYTARPFWNSSVLGPLFLTSGISTALALVMFFSRSDEEYRDFLKLDLGVIVLELLLLFVFGYGLITSTQSAQQAISLITGGPLTAMFWIPFVILGLALPIVLELFELFGGHAPRKLAPALLLLGGFFFRVVMVQGGQLSTWTPY